MKNNGCFTPEDSKRIGLLSQLNIEQCQVEILEAALKESRKRNKKIEEKQNDRICNKR